MSRCRREVNNAAIDRYYGISRKKILKLCYAKGYSCLVSSGSSIDDTPLPKRLIIGVVINKTRGNLNVNQNSIKRGNQINNSCTPNGVSRASYTLVRPTPSQHEFKYSGIVCLNKINKGYIALFF